VISHVRHGRSVLWYPQPCERRHPPSRFVSADESERALLLAPPIYLIPPQCAGHYSRSPPGGTEGRLSARPSYRLHDCIAHAVIRLALPATSAPSAIRRHGMCCF
jgi:hypothetical protein